jgi:hypothetical protein
MPIRFSENLIVHYVRCIGEVPNPNDPKAEPRRCSHVTRAESLSFSRSWIWKCVACAMRELKAAGGTIVFSRVIR